MDDLYKELIKNPDEDVEIDRSHFEYEDEDARERALANPSQTNLLIRRILESFNKKTYIGYTATPYANIFIYRDLILTNYFSFSVYLSLCNLIFSLVKLCRFLIINFNARISS